MKQSGSGRVSVPGPGPLLARSPSFSEHSSGAMAYTAARVVSEFAKESEDTCYYQGNDVVCYSPVALSKNVAYSDQKERRCVHQDDVEQQQEEDDGDSDFEFAVPGVGEFSSPISADEIFQNGRIKPIYPVFNTDLVSADTDWRNYYRVDGEIRSPALEVEKNSNSKSEERSPIRPPLEKLMISGRERPLTESVSCSCSEGDELEGVAPETYCVWAPNQQGMRKKSQSTGSSQRWKFRDLLYRSHSDGGDALHISTSKAKNDQKKASKGKHPDSAGSSGAGDGKKKKASGGSDRKMAYLIGWFANMNGLSRAVQPF